MNKQEGNIMIRDLDFIKDISPLFEKYVVVWGMGNLGRKFLNEIKSIGAGKRGILLCDSKDEMWGKTIAGYEVLSPHGLQKNVNGIGIQNIIILVTVYSTQMQNEILRNIEKMFGDAVEIYTECAVENGLYLNINNPYIDEKIRDIKLAEHEKNILQMNERFWQREHTLKYFAFLPLHNDDIILIYQMGKVGSSSLYKSIQYYNRYVLQCHVLEDISVQEYDLQKLLNLKFGKIITLVRDPVARRISEMWENMLSRTRYSAAADFKEVEEYYFKEGFWKGDREWFDEQLKSVFQIDVFRYPFDTEKGYTIIKEGNIELLLMKMEKLNDLEKVIGEFLDIDSFHVRNANVGNQKTYRFALKEYKKTFSLSEKELNDLYRKSDYMKHFYSEQERNEFYMKWKNYPGGQDA